MTINKRKTEKNYFSFFIFPFSLMVLFSAVSYADFTRDANGIVTDSTTGLEWQDDSKGSIMGWQSAIDHCEALTLGSHEDWRLPNLNELTSLVDDAKYNPSIDDVFTSTASSPYWSSTTYPQDSNYNHAWNVHFLIGTQNRNRKSYYYFVRCVRAGQ